MSDKINLTPEQLAEVKAFFQQNDFTANMAVEREYNMTGDKAKVFARSKKIFGEYWLGNLRSLGVKRQMKNFSKNYPLNFLENADADFISENVAEIFINDDALNKAVEVMFSMYAEPIEKGLVGYAGQLEKSVDDLTDDEILFIVEKVAEVANEVNTNVLMQGQQVPEVFGVSQKVQQHEDFTGKRSPDKINFYNKWTHANTKLGAPLLFCEICEKDENGEIICDETNGIEGAKNFFANNPDADAMYKLLKEDFFSTLSETDREILNLYEKGFSQKEIAQRLGYKTHSAVSKRMKTMNADFKKYLGFTD